MVNNEYISQYNEFDYSTTPIRLLKIPISADNQGINLRFTIEISYMSATVNIKSEIGLSISRAANSSGITQNLNYLNNHNNRFAVCGHFDGTNTYSLFVKPSSGLSGGHGFIKIINSSTDQFIFDNTEMAIPETGTTYQANILNLFDTVTGVSIDTRFKNCSFSNDNFLVISCGITIANDLEDLSPILNLKNTNFQISGIMIKVDGSFVTPVYRTSTNLVNRYALTAGNYVILAIGGSNPSILPSFS